MNADQRVQVERLFEEALRRPSEQWPAFLDDAGTDPQTRSHVESLLSAHREATTLDGPVPAAAPDVAPFVGRRIGAYEVTRHIASGGMGSVYEALQDMPRRTVALKVMKRGFNLKRFEHESQTLARLRHPAIAHVYEAGTVDDDGAPLAWFAMEYIPNARPITTYAEAWELSVPERVGLFLEVCDAVEHAHLKGVAHCDLKPANILVESSGRPKVIDFGVARAIDTDVAVGGRPGGGTPAYMSPEQWDADPHDLDHRTDVYALGIVLHELLWGRLPDADGHAAAKGADPDLQAIAIKAHQRRSDLRYRSVGELASALDTWLTDRARHAETVAASASRRRSVRVTFGALTLIAVTVSLLALTAGMLVPRHPVPADDAPPQPPTVVASDRTVTPPRSAWSPAVEVSLSAEWYDATRPFDVVGRPERPGPDDYFRLAIGADASGQVYLFQVTPDATVVAHAGAVAAQACTPHAFTAGRSPQWLGTYHTAGTPGHYRLVALLAGGVMPELCAHVDEGLAGEAPQPDGGQAFAERIERMLSGADMGDRIMGYAVFDYAVHR